MTFIPPCVATPDRIEEYPNWRLAAFEQIRPHLGGHEGVAGLDHSENHNWRRLIRSLCDPRVFHTKPFGYAHPGVPHPSTRTTAVVGIFAELIAQTMRSRMAEHLSDRIYETLVDGLNSDNLWSQYLQPRIARNLGSMWKVRAHNGTDKNVSSFEDGLPFYPLLHLILVGMRNPDAKTHALRALSSVAALTEPNNYMCGNVQIGRSVVWGREHQPAGAIDLKESSYLLSVHQLGLWLTDEHVVGDVLADRLDSIYYTNNEVWPRLIDYEGVPIGANEDGSIVSADRGIWPNPEYLKDKSKPRHTIGVPTTTRPESQLHQWRQAVTLYKETPEAAQEAAEKEKP
jgi:hypothetical protein